MLYHFIEISGAPPPVRPCRARVPQGPRSSPAVVNGRPYPVGRQTVSRLTPSTALRIGRCGVCVCVCVRVCAMYAPMHVCAYAGMCLQQLCIQVVASFHHFDDDLLVALRRVCIPTLVTRLVPLLERSVPL